MVLLVDFVGPASALSRHGDPGAAQQACGELEGATYIGQSLLRQRAGGPGSQARARPRQGREGRRRG
eukprot:9921800-Alexandrium_andersonii.AAC.1